MSLFNKRIKRNIAKKLDRSILEISKMPWLYRLFYPRKYARNSYQWKKAERLFSANIAILGVGVLLFIYLPFTTTIFLAFFSVTLWGLITRANEDILSPIVFLLLGGILCWQHIDIGLSIFKWHFDGYFYQAFIISGALSILWHFCNAMIWRYLDNCVYRTYQKCKLDFNMAYEPITDYQLAYYATRDRLEKLTQFLPLIEKRIALHPQHIKEHLDAKLTSCQNTLDTYLSIIDEVTHAN